MFSLDRCELSWPRLKRRSDLLESSEDEELDDEELDDEDNLDLGIARLERENDDLRSQKLKKVCGLRGRYPERVTSPSPFFFCMRSKAG